MEQTRKLQRILRLLTRFGGIAAAALSTQLSCCNAGNLPKDNELVASFRSHREVFEKLAAMAMEDYGTVSLLSPEMLLARPLSDGRQNLSPQRRDEYMRLLTSIKPDLVMGIDFYRITFSYSRGGLLSIGPGTMKGMAYLPRGPERVGIVVSNLDKPPTQDDVYLVPIDKNWYIIYVHLD